MLTEARSATPSESASFCTPPPGFPPAHVQPTAPSHSAHPHTASCARLLQTADILPETARLVRCHNPWPSEDVLFCPDGTLPAFVTGIPALSSGPELWYALHNHRPEPLQLHAGQSIGVLEVVHLAEASASAPPSSPHPPSPCQPTYPKTSPPCSNNSSMSSSRSSRTYSVRVTTTWVILLCCSMGSRPMAPLSTNHTGGRTLQFVGKRWRRFSRCCPATLFDPRTALGPLR